LIFRTRVNLLKLLHAKAKRCDGNTKYRKKPGIRKNRVKLVCAAAAGKPLIVFLTKEVKYIGPAYNLNHRYLMATGKADVDLKSTGQLQVT